jgi:N utilization substance protein A
MLIEEGFLSCEDIAVLTPAEMCAMGGMDEDTAAEMIAFADEEAARLEKEARLGKPRESAQVATPAPAPAQPAEAPSSGRKAFDSLFAPLPESESKQSDTAEQPEGTLSSEPSVEISLPPDGPEVSEPVTEATMATVVEGEQTPTDTPQELPPG